MLLFAMIGFLPAAYGFRVLPAEILLITHKGKAFALPL
jgi:hypothetical protein